MANPGNREIWENGVPLNDAWLEFANADAKRRYSERATLEAFNEQADAAKMQSAHDISKMLLTGIRHWSENGQLQRELQELLLDELFNDQLHAYGFRTAPSPSRAPVRIAADSFECPVMEWSRNRMSVRGYGYSEIQIVDPTKIVDWTKPRPGSKGSGDAIRAAIAAVQSRHSDFCTIPRKSAFDLIRREIGGAQPNGSGLSNPNLAKYVNAVCGTRRIEGK